MTSLVFEAVDLAALGEGKEGGHEEKGKYTKDVFQSVRRRWVHEEGEEVKWTSCGVPIGKLISLVDPR